MAPLISGEKGREGEREEGEREEREEGEREEGEREERERERGRREKEEKKEKRKGEKGQRKGYKFSDLKHTYLQILPGTNISSRHIPFRNFNKMLIQ